MNETTIETSGRLFEIIEDGAFFEPYSRVNGMNGMFMEIEHSSDDEDGTYPLIMHYITLVKKMDESGAPAWLNRNAKDKLNIDYDGMKIVRKSQWDSEATLIFKEPITVVFGKVGEELITHKVSKITGEFTYEWFWTKRGRQDKYANGFNIYFECKTFEL